MAQCRFVLDENHDPEMPVLHPDGSVSRRGHRLDVERGGLPTDDEIVLPVRWHARWSATSCSPRPARLHGQRSSSAGLPCPWQIRWPPCSGNGRPEPLVEDDRVWMARTVSEPECLRRG